MDNFLKQKENLKSHKRILDNLFDIHWNDPAIFTNIDKEYNIDIFTKFGSKAAEDVYKKDNFAISLIEQDLLFFISDLKRAIDFNEVTKITKKHNYKLEDEVISAFERNFQKSLQTLIQNLEDKYQKTNTRWKKYFSRANEINRETNVWPLHVGFAFVSISTEKRNIYAPLFFKEVSIKTVNSQPFLISNGDIRINEKLIYLLEQEGFSFDLDFDPSILPISQVYEKISLAWDKLYSFPQIIGPIEKQKPHNIKNKKLTFHEGMVLGFFQASGGHQRKLMEEIIRNDELETILEVDFDKNKYKDRIKKVIYERPFRFLKINKTNYSQDRATVSAISQNTIIWGPPGTGKSQTISNIIANIIAFGKTALVVSQKKAALDVLRKRMKHLSLFCLFILNDKNMNKKNFYEPIKKFLSFIENIDSKPKVNPLTIISKEEKEWVDLVTKVKSINNFEKAIRIYSLMKQNQLTLSNNAINAFYRISKKVDLNPSDYSYDNVKKLKMDLTECHNGKKVSMIQKFFPKFSERVEEETELILDNLYYFNDKLSIVTSHLDDISKEEILAINDLYTFALEPKKEINDDKIIAKWMAWNLAQKIKLFTNEQKKLYSKFSIAVRSGHRDPYKFVLDHQEMIKILFPIIISTPETELSPWKKQEFDYAILDESSQIFLEKGLPILYLAKIKVLAGDDKQMQPTRWFASRSFEEDIQLGNIESLLDYAVAKGVYAILLDKNYRSNYASLMTFSSKHFYDSKLDVLDKFVENPFNPIEVIEADGKWEEGKNEVEAQIVIQQALNNLAKFKKIIILTFNSNQQSLIETMIFEKYPELEQALETEQIILKNIENIQGDEADLMIVSVVYDKLTKLHSTYVAKRGGKNALNVAISRAKEKMIIIKSIKAEEIDTLGITDDMNIFRKWLLFLELNEESKKTYTLQNEEFLEENTFTQTLEFFQDETLLDEVYKEIKSWLESKNKDEQAISIEKNYKVGTKEIDIVLLDSKKSFKLGLSIDNYDYANSYEEYIKFNDKNKFLSSKEYKIIAIKRLEWYTNRKEIMANIEKELFNND